MSEDYEGLEKNATNLNNSTETDTGKITDNANWYVQFLCLRTAFA